MAQMRGDYKRRAARPAAAKAPKPVSTFMAAPAETWAGLDVVAEGDTGVFVGL
jgi:hypothetical protein